jgi:hypothetical protein
MYIFIIKQVTINAGEMSSALEFGRRGCRVRESG